MSWLKEQFDMLREFLGAGFQSVALFCALGLLGSAAVGVGIGLAAPEVVMNIVENFMAQVQEAGVIDEAGNLSVFTLLTNNWTAMMISALYGFIPFLFLPLFSLFSNGALLGMLGAVYHANGLSLGVYLAGILPHGIFELPALVLSIACGVYLCRNMCRLVLGRSDREPLVELLSDLLRVLLLLVLPMTAAAAAIECYVTPVILDFFL